MTPKMNRKGRGRGRGERKRKRKKKMKKKKEKERKKKCSGFVQVCKPEYIPFLGFLRNISFSHK